MCKSFLIFLAHSDKVTLTMRIGDLNRVVFPGTFPVLFTPTIRPTIPAAAPYFPRYDLEPGFSR